MSSPTFKLIVLGSGGVGKSALSIQYIQKKFVARYDPTIEDSYRKQMQVDGQDVMVEILDTAGQEEYAYMRAQYMRAGHGFLIVYSITEARGFEDCSDLYEELLNCKQGEKFNLILVGNKADLQAERVIATDKGTQLALKFGCPFLETSAKTRQNVARAFEDLTRLVLQQHASPGEPASPAPHTDTPTVRKARKRRCLIL
eukprot:NODE_4841_length_733_cov_46.927393_g4679_i0.p1 GENE.NODE_4841_length_733_cov_46.927393_g4679_i0~~NODE_4841_length_733_cov_46.927393_g4679_i0.p1  ORF type:complete len:231 (-),score=53.94 NODE_4841_length_733_cov_46.927393_g4679_i0:39-638(-)